jgi:hypothetical protein
LRGGGQYYLRRSSNFELLAWRGVSWFYWVPSVNYRIIVPYMRLWPVPFQILSNPVRLSVNPLFDGNLQYILNTRLSNKLTNRGITLYLRCFLFESRLGYKLSCMKPSCGNAVVIDKASLFEPGSKTTTISCKTYSSILFSWWDGNFLTSANHVSCYFICLYCGSSAGTF